MLSQPSAERWTMSQPAPEFQRTRRSAEASTAQLTPAHVKLLECALAGTPPWECLPDVICLIAYLDELVARRYLVVEGRSYGITPQGRQFLTALKPQLA